MVESKCLARLEIPAQLLIDALAQISNISNKAVIRPIVNKKDDKAILGISFQNVAHCGNSELQFDIFASFPITNDDIQNSVYGISNGNEWPVCYVACTPEFIKSLSMLPPRTQNDKKILRLEIWDIRDGRVLKSEVAFVGNHGSYISSIIQSTDEKYVDGHIIPISNLEEMTVGKSYT